MSFVKVATSGGALILNTDCVESINPATNKIQIHAGSCYVLTPNSLAYLLVCVEAQDALISEAPEPPSLKTRIAQALRNEFPSGTNLSGLTTHFGDIPFNHIQEALAVLIAENVAVVVAASSGLPTYKHRAHLTTSDESTISKPQPKT